MSQDIPQSSASSRGNQKPWTNSRKPTFVAWQSSEVPIFQSPSTWCHFLGTYRVPGPCPLRTLAAWPAAVPTCVEQYKGLREHHHWEYARAEMTSTSAALPASGWPPSLPGWYKTTQWASQLPKHIPRLANKHMGLYNPSLPTRQSGPAHSLFHITSLSQRLA